MSMQTATTPISEVGHQSRSKDSTLIQKTGKFRGTVDLISDDGHKYDLRKFSSISSYHDDEELVEQTQTALNKQSGNRGASKTWAETAATASRSGSLSPILTRRRSEVFNVPLNKRRNVDRTPPEGRKSVSPNDVGQHQGVMVSLSGKKKSKTDTNVKH